MARKNSSLPKAAGTQALVAATQQQADSSAELAATQNTEIVVSQDQKISPAADQVQQIENATTDLTTDHDTAAVASHNQQNTEVVNQTQQVKNETTDLADGKANEPVQSGYVVNRDSLEHDGKPYGMGDPISITDEKQLRALLKLDAIIPAEAANAVDSN